MPYQLGDAPKKPWVVKTNMAGADGFEPPMLESESSALPLGDAPIIGKFGVAGGARTLA